MKTTAGGINAPFFVSENELRLAEALGSSFWLYRVFVQDGKRRIFRLRGPLEEVLHLEPMAYRARVRAQSPNAMIAEDRQRIAAASLGANEGATE